MARRILDVAVIVEAAREGRAAIHREAEVLEHAIGGAIQVENRTLGNEELEARRGNGSEIRLKRERVGAVANDAQTLYAAIGWIDDVQPLEMANVSLPLIGGPGGLA